MQRFDHHDEAVAPELAALGLEDKPDGPAAAAMISAGFGIFMLGFFTTGAVIWSGLKDFLADFQGSRGVGPLAGKTTLGTLLWLVAWAVLAYIWKDKDVELPKAFRIGLILGIIGAILMFPPVFEAFE
ncbi:MAG TPA: hypothetical protein VK960_06160 [Acidimicrobiia bacterium]|nr:hypothetical protein [Acidimicrobiia bacterium]